MTLRDRKKAAQRNAFKEAAAELRAETDEQVTVEAVCERAGASVPTFFRYFGTALAFWLELFEERAGPPSAAHLEAELGYVLGDGAAAARILSLARAALARERRS